MGTAPLFLHPIFCQTKSRLATSLPLILTLILRIKMTVSSQQAASWWMAASEGRENMHMQVSLSLLNSSDKAWTWRSCGSICVNSITEPTALKSLWINLWQCINQTWSQKVLNKSTPAPPSSGVFLGCVRSGEVGGPLRQQTLKHWNHVIRNEKEMALFSNHQRRWWLFSAANHSIYHIHLSSSGFLCFT